MNLIAEDVGVQIVKEICTDMKIEKEWRINSERGFEWWGNHFKQKIWADPPMENTSTSSHSQIKIGSKFNFHKRS